MLAGQTATYQGSEVALLPFDYVNITQNSGSSSLSHCCGHATDFAFPRNRYPVYAPFSCHETSGYDSAAGRSFTSDAPVWTVNHGLTYVTIRIVHDDSPMSGTSFSQGELIGHSGSSPSTSVTGDHCHLDTAPIANASLVNYGVVCQYGNTCWALNDSTLPSQIFYTTGDENIVNTTATGITLSFTQWDGEITPPEPPEPPEPHLVRNKKRSLWWKFMTVRRSKGFFIRLKTKKKGELKQWQLRHVMNY